MKTVFIIVSIFFAFIIQAFLFRLGFFGTIEPPLLLLTVFYWLWRLPFGERIIFSILVSLFFESMSIFPQGGYFVVLLSLANCPRIVQSLFMNAKPYVTRMIGAFVFLFFTVVLMGAYSFLFDVVRGSETGLGMQWVSFLLWSLGWAFVYSSVTHILYRNAVFHQKKIPQYFS